MGRARNARPRDGLGRPMPRGAVGEPTMPEDLALGDAETLHLAQQLLDTGRPFHAHEVLESRWKATSDPYWQGLAQLAVGLTHQARGNEAGARRLVERGRDTLAATGAGAAALVRWADDWLIGRRDRPLALPGRAAAAP